MMPQLRLTDAAVRFGGTLINPDCHFSTVAINSRNINEGDLFVALIGERFDAHRFLNEAAEKASGLVVSAPDKKLPLPQWVVADTTKALGDLAILRREAFAGQVIAITGSTGKTSVKEAVTAILRQSNRVHATTGNLNNHIGVPLTVLSMPAEADMAVIEMGASAGGEIGYLCAIAKPHVALINNVQTSHIEGFGSIEAVAAAKGEIYAGLEALGTAVINLDDPWCCQWLEQLEGKKQVTFSSQNASADLFAEDIQLLANGCYRYVLCLGVIDGDAAQEQIIELTAPGLHQVSNSLAAAACAIAAGVKLSQIAAGLASVAAIAGRQEIKLLGNGAKVIDDSYNASPSSFVAAIDVLADCSGRRVLVMGDMGELGSSEVMLHRRVGEYAQQAGLDAVYSLGTLSAGATEVFGGRHFESQDSLIEALIDELQSSETTCLVKGSRSSGMDQIVAMLLLRGNPSC
jgi:UDP-N-acetylmuramoyl-tripeptide--D-alanyl-D-alanine ligase